MRTQLFVNLRTQLTQPRLAKEHFSLEFAVYTTGTALQTHLAEKWRIPHDSEQHVPNSNTVSLGAGKDWLIIAAATEG